MRIPLGILAIGLLMFCATPAVDLNAAGRVPTIINVRPTQNVPKTRIYIRSSADEQRTLEFRRTLMEWGAEKVNLFLPSLIVCEVPEGTDLGQLVKDPDFTYIEEAGIGPETTAAAPEIVRVREAYALAENLLRGPGAELTHDDFNDVVRHVPPEVVEASKSLGQPSQLGSAGPVRNVQQNAEFLIGDILVQLVFPESDGPAESWTNEELSGAGQGAAIGMLSLQERYDYADIDFIFQTAPRVRTVYEPIHHEMNTDALWITDVLSSLGVAQQRDELLTTHVYNNQGRARYGTDWVYTAFIADSRNEPGNRFRGANYTAYANLGGPYLVQPYPAGGDPNLLGEVIVFAQIFQHESIHIFWGLDEYPSAPSQCNSHSGYLNYTNQNKQTLLFDGTIGGCPNYVDCVMWGARNRDVPVCFYTAGQIGVVDRGNAQERIPDIFDIPPIVEFEAAAVETVLVPEITVNMKAISVPVKNHNPVQAPEDRIDYAAPLKNATMSVDGVGAIALTPLDGRWDEAEEDLSFAISGLSPGLTRIQITARNVYGRQSEKIEKKVYFTALKFALFSFQVEREGIEVRWSTVGETFDAKLDLYRIETTAGHRDTVLVKGDVQPDDGDGDTFKFYTWSDDTVVPGRAYKYYVTGHVSIEYDGEVLDFYPTSNAFDVSATLPIAAGKIVSSAAPNPFRGTTTISIDIPRSFAEQESEGGPQGPTGLQREIPTAVSIAVYDVKGRLVKNVYEGQMFSRVETFRWDGTNVRNEPVASGIYFIKAGAGTVTEVKKVVVLH